MEGFRFEENRNLVIVFHADLKISNSFLFGPFLMERTVKYLIYEILKPENVGGNLQVKYFDNNCDVMTDAFMRRFIRHSRENKGILFNPYYKQRECLAYVLLELEVKHLHWSAKFFKYYHEEKEEKESDSSKKENLLNIPSPDFSITENIDEDFNINSP